MYRSIPVSYTHLFEPQGAGKEFCRVCRMLLNVGVSGVYAVPLTVDGSQAGEELYEGALRKLCEIKRGGVIPVSYTHLDVYKRQDGAYAREIAQQMASQWADTMRESGQVKDFVAVGDVDIKVIGADNQALDTQVPVRQMLEQIVAKLGLPPFILGLSWSTTEDVYKRQAPNRRES